MNAPVTVPLTEAQRAVFSSLAEEERTAREILAALPKARSAAAMMVLGATHEIAEFQGRSLEITDTGITFTPNELPSGPSLVVASNA